MHKMCFTVSNTICISLKIVHSFVFWLEFCISLYVILSFCLFLGHCIICPSSIYRFLLPLCIYISYFIFIICVTKDQYYFFSGSDCYLLKVFGGLAIGRTVETSKDTTKYTNTFLSREHLSFLRSKTRGVGDLDQMHDILQSQHVICLQMSQETQFKKKNNIGSYNKI